MAIRQVYVESISYTLAHYLGLNEDYIYSMASRMV